MLWLAVSRSLEQPDQPPLGPEERLVALPAPVGEVLGAVRRLAALLADVPADELAAAARSVAELIVQVQALADRLGAIADLKRRVDALD